MLSNTGATVSNKLWKTDEILGALVTTTFSKPLNKLPANLLPTSTMVDVKLNRVDTIALPIRTAPVEVMTS